MLFIALAIAVALVGADVLALTNRGDRRKDPLA
jgi:hypothetical protein